MKKIKNHAYGHTNKGMDENSQESSEYSFEVPENFNLFSQDIAMLQDTKKLVK